MINKGVTAITNAMFGTTQVKEIYLGSTKVWSKMITNSIYVMPIPNTVSASASYNVTSTLSVTIAVQNSSHGTIGTYNFTIPQGTKSSTSISVPGAYYFCVVGVSPTFDGTYDYVKNGNWVP